MAPNAHSAEKIELAAKYVQEMGISGEEPPAMYCQRDCVVGSLETCCLPLMEIAVIDMGLLAFPSPSKQELEKLRSAISSFGCFMAINHGMTSSFLNEVHSVSKQFFALPKEEKQKFAKEVNSREGYGTDIVFSENQVLDWNDRLVLVLTPEGQRQLRFWPEYPANFVETVSEYTTKLQLITELVLKAMAMSLNLEDRCFFNKYGDQATMRARFNLFPPCSRHDLVLGLKPHSDPSIITIVLQDEEVEGLQMLKDNQWFRVPIIPDGLLINIGDQMEIMSNGLFKSPIHRVIINLEEERFSLAVFCLPDPENDIEPVDELVDESRPRRYKKVKNFVGGVNQRYNLGMRAIDNVKI